MRACGSSIQSSLPCVLRSSRGVGPLNPKWSSRVGPRRSILAEVNTDGGTLALARTLIAPIVAIANATATSFRITATSTPASKDSCRLWRSPRPDLPFPLLLLEARGEAGEGVQRVHRGHALEVEGAQFVEHRAFARREQAELRCGSFGAPVAGDPRHPGFVEFALLEVGENLARAGDDRIWQPRQARHLDTITSRRRLLDDAAQKNHLGAPFAHGHAQVLDPRTLAREVGQLVEVGR